MNLLIQSNSVIVNSKKKSNSVVVVVTFFIVPLCLLFKLIFSIDIQKKKKTYIFHCLPIFKKKNSSQALLSKQKILKS